MNNFELMLSKVSAEDPQAVIITRDFNCLSPQWWDYDNENDEGKKKIRIINFRPWIASVNLWTNPHDW